MALSTPRNIVGYEETGLPDDLTFKIDNSTIVYDGTAANGAATTMIGKAVTLSADDTVALAADGDAVVGKLISVEADNKCSVRVHGFVALPAGASATVTRGKKIVGALGASSAKGYIRDAVIAGGTYAAAEANEIQKARGLIIDVGTTTAVGVILGA
jgi:hypothetical protein